MSTKSIFMKLFIKHLHVLTGAGKTPCPPGARYGHCEDCQVRGSQGSRHGEGIEASQRRKHLSEVALKRQKNEP